MSVFQILSFTSTVDPVINNQQPARRTVLLV